jgi:hypothetical protein
VFKDDVKLKVTFEFCLGEIRRANDSDTSYKRNSFNDIGLAVKKFLLVSPYLDLILA